MHKLENCNGQIDRKTQAIKTDSGRQKILSKLMTYKDIDMFIKNFSKKNPRPEGLTSEFYQTLKKERDLTPILLKLFQQVRPGNTT